MGYAEAYAAPSRTLSPPLVGRDSVVGFRARGAGRQLIAMALDIALPGRARSPWMDDTPVPPQYAPLEGEAGAEVAVVGAGFVGVTAAYLLAVAGVDVALVEADRVGAGVSGHTTAKVSSLQGTMLSRIASSHDEDTARAYGQANEAGLARIFELAGELGISCDLRRRENHTYAVSADRLGAVREEAALAARLGLPAAFMAKLDLPFEVAGAVRFRDQAQLHPRRYLLGLAQAARTAGARIFEGTRVLSAGFRAPLVLRTADNAILRAEKVIIATHMPILDRGLFFAREHAERSYAITARVRGELPSGMYLSADAPTRSLRALPFEGGELLMVGGEGHRAGYGDVAPRYRALESWIREHFDVAEIVHRFSSQDNMPVDHLPFVGPMTPGNERLLTATGFQKWGIAMGTTAGAMLSESILGRPGPWTTLFDPRRVNPRASAAELAKSNALVVLRMVGDRLKRGSADGLAPGEGRIVGDGLGQTALARDPDGTLHAVSARCTHLGCIVAWNSGERSWDCPCHGSRFAPDGSILHGPAVRPLAPREPPG